MEFLTFFQVVRYREFHVEFRAVVLGTQAVDGKDGGVNFRVGGVLLLVDEIEDLAAWVYRWKAPAANRCRPLSSYSTQHWRPRVVLT